MKRKIGLLMTVLFALTLTSQTILALDHDPFDPRYNGSYEIVASKDGEPWIDQKEPGDNNLGNSIRNKFDLFDALELLYLEYNWIGVFITKIIIVENNNLQGTNNDKANGITDNKSDEPGKSAPSDM